MQTCTRGALFLGLCALFLGVAAVASAQDEGTSDGSAALQEMADLKTRINALEARLNAASSSDNQSLEELKNEQKKLASQLKVLESRVMLLEPAEGVEPKKDEEPLFDLETNGFMRVGYEAVLQGDAEETFVGLNDGFYVGNARFSFQGTRDVFRFRLQIDAGVDQRNSENSATGVLVPRLRDAFIEYRPASYVNVRIGQSKPVFDQEALRTASNTLFVSRAVEARGVVGVEGINVDGLSVDRDKGVFIYSDPLMTSSGFGAAYYLSVVNGVPSDQPANDNESVAVFGRVEALWRDKATLGLGFYVNERTLGEQPDLFNEDRQGLAVDLDVNDLYGVYFQAQYMSLQRKFVDVPQEPDRTSSGFHVALGYDIGWGLIPAYRYASYDPTAKFTGADPTIGAELNNDSLEFHTIGLTWDVPKQAVRFQANYTIANEDDARAIDNDRLEFLGQVEF